MFSTLIVVVAVALASKMALAQCPCYGDTYSMACDNSSLTSIPDCVPSNISLLYIRTPSIPLVPDTISRFESLAGIYIEFFDNPQMSKNFLSAHPNMEEFGISNTNLSIVDSEWFLYSLRMKYLFLYNNRITSLAPETFSSMPLLETVYLDHNQLISLPPTLFQGTSLRFLFLMGNPWQCDCELATYIQWLTGYAVKIGDNATCLYPSNLEGLELTQLSPEAVCKK